MDGRYTHMQLSSHFEIVKGQCFLLFIISKIVFLMDFHFVTLYKQILHNFVKRSL